jgi:poly(A) polymerase
MDVAENLRLSKAKTRRLDVLRSDMSPVEAAYRHDAQMGLDKLAIESASLGQDLDAYQATAVRFSADQRFPITAQDMMPALTGAALGQALKAAETRWIASGFTLTKADLLG